MLVTIRLARHRLDISDLLRQRVAGERNVLQRDRFRTVLLAVDEGSEVGEVARRLGRSPRFVDEGAGHDRRGMLEAIVPLKPRGATPYLTREQQVRLKARLDEGRTPEDGV
jgi:hypothetical protein